MYLDITWIDKSLNRLLQISKSGISHTRRLLQAGRARKEDPSSPWWLPPLIFLTPPILPIGLQVTQWCFPMNLAHYGYASSPLFKLIFMGLSGLSKTSNQLDVSGAILLKRDMAWLSELSWWWDGSFACLGSFGECWCIPTFPF